jgi:two-component system LytT family response regulator
MLEMMLKYSSQKVEVVGKAVSVNEGKVLIRRHSPDIVLLDIELNGGNGFDILDDFISTL